MGNCGESVKDTLNMPCFLDTRLLAGMFLIDILANESQQFYDLQPQSLAHYDGNGRTVGIRYRMSKEMT